MRCQKEKVVKRFTTRRTAQQRRVAGRVRAFEGVPVRESGPGQNQQQRPPTMKARIPLQELEPWIRQLPQDAETQGLDETTIHQRITRFMAEHQEAMTEHALSFQRITHEMNHGGQRIEQLHRMAHYSEVMGWIESFVSKNLFLTRE